MSTSYQTAPMTPVQKIKHAILLKAESFGDIDLAGTQITADNVDELFDAYGESWALTDATNEIRLGTVETGLHCETSRHYESKAVATQMPDGSWVGWTCWYGGGKHGEPEAVEWMEDAYDVKVSEEEKLVVVRTFEKVSA